MRSIYGIITLGDKNCISVSLFALMYLCYIVPVLNCQLVILFNLLGFFISNTTKSNELLNVIKKSQKSKFVSFLCT